MVDPRFMQEGFEKRLSHFMEECGEAITAGCKTQRWGRESYDPTLPPEDRETNDAWLRREIADVKETAERLLEAMDQEAI